MAERVSVGNAMSSLEAFVNNDAELAQAFGGNERVRLRENQRTGFQKEKFLNQIVKVRLLDPSGFLLEGCEWTMSRRRLTLDKIMVLIKRSPLPNTEIDFFYDETGVPIWMEDMMLKAQAIPSFYTIVPQVKRTPFDIRDDPTYEGQVVFSISQVPLKAKDEETVVNEATLREWLVFAITEEDPHSKPLFAKLQPVRDIIAEIDKKIKGITKMKFFEEDGKPMSDEKAEAERELLYNAFGEDRLVAEKRLRKFQANYDAHVAWRKTIGLDFEQAGDDENTGTATWNVRIYGHEDAEQMEDLLIRKGNWSGIKLASGNDKVSPKIPPWAGRGPVPDGSPPLCIDYTLLQVNVAGARFKRLPNGVGAVKSLDRSSSNIAADQFSMYYGNFELGKKVGVALEINEASVYSGRFIEGHRRGKGRIDFGDGTLVVGEFGYNTVYDNKITLVFDNPYVGGEPNHDDCEVLFADGAIYRGSMVDGRIHGKGEYQSAMGDVVMGTFVNGTLQGEDGYVKNSSGEEWWGTWEIGELDGFGKYRNARGDSFEGYYDRGLRHGRGVATYARLGRYRGYFVNGARNGKGELEYGPRPKEKKKKKKRVGVASPSREPGAQPPQEEEEQEQANLEPPKSEFLHLFQGYFLAGNVTNGGITHPVDTQVPSVVARMDKRKLQPIQHVLDREAANTKKLQRQVEKLNDMEGYIRGEMIAKKLKMFRQQRHFTKRAMYNADQWGNFPKKELESRAIIREARLNRMDESVLKPKNARVPHLQLISVKPADHLRPVFSHIEALPKNGPTDKIVMGSIHAAVSDFEEVAERQRFLKYDAIWQRAENAFRQKKRAQLSGEGGEASEG